MTTQQVADRYYELSQENNAEALYRELFDPNAENIEPAHAAAIGMVGVKGVEAIKKKGEEFNSLIEEMHSGYCTKPIVAGNFFTLAMGMDVTMKGMGRQQMDEVGVFEVKDGKIVKEQFFY